MEDYQEALKGLGSSVFKTWARMYLLSNNERQELQALRQVAKVYPCTIPDCDKYVAVCLRQDIYSHTSRNECIVCKRRICDTHTMVLRGIRSCPKCYAQLERLE